MIFFSRWLQAPLYFGLILAQMVYVYHFMVELWHLFEKAHHITETDIMLAVLGLIDVVMIANLLIMVIVGGYETFVSRLNSQDILTSRNGFRMSTRECLKSSWQPRSSGFPRFTCSRLSLALRTCRTGLSRGRSSFISLL
jgi:uncharacterized protein (TIGR00645 family)